jgi:hypothetical protein
MSAFIADADRARRGGVRANPAPVGSAFRAGTNSAIRMQRNPRWKRSLVDMTEDPPVLNVTIDWEANPKNSDDLDDAAAHSQIRVILRDAPEQPPLP